MPACPGTCNECCGVLSESCCCCCCSRLSGSGAGDRKAGAAGAGVSLISCRVKDSKRRFCSSGTSEVAGGAVEGTPLLNDAAAVGGSGGGGGSSAG